MSRNKFGQNASQAIGLAVEGQTQEMQIVGIHIENKLCPVGSRRRNEGFDVACPNHPGCTATMIPPDPFSEKRIGQHLGDYFKKQQIKVKYVITDGDGRSAEGFQTAERQADTTHLGQSQFRHLLGGHANGWFPSLWHIDAPGLPHSVP